MQASNYIYKSFPQTDKISRPATAWEAKYRREPPYKSVRLVAGNVRHR